MPEVYFAWGCFRHFCWHGPIRQERAPGGTVPAKVRRDSQGSLPKYEISPYLNEMAVELMLRAGLLPARDLW
ncbi:MAG: hypothetical protein DI543_14725 [Bradyrhizobium icense]|nr:MAG: hypothetical protein DI543_14725 [Bradyrhizobium icense]